MNNFYLRNQKLIDTKTSYKWRNDKAVWKKTLGSGNFKNNNKVSLQDEINWYKKIKKQNNRKNLSIVLRNDKLIGYIYFTNIVDHEAEFQIVIGERRFWNKGFGYKASKLSLLFAFLNFRINFFYLYVKKTNKNAIKLYKKIGFKRVNSSSNEIYKMKYNLNEKF